MRNSSNKLYQAAVNQGALLRPLGNTIYWLPPLNIDIETVFRLGEITLNALHEVQQKYERSVYA